MDKERFKQLKSIVNLDYQNRHDSPQLYFTLDDLKWFIATIELTPIGDLSVIESLIAERKMYMEQIAELQEEVRLWREIGESCECNN